MKTKSLLLNFLLVLPLAVLAAACGKSGGGSSTAVSGYYVYNSQCYVSGTVTQTAVTNCQTGTYYRWVGNVCLDPSNNNVGVQYCNNNQVFTNTCGINGGINNGLNGGIYGNNGINNGYNNGLNSGCNGGVGGINGGIGGINSGVGGINGGIGGGFGTNAILCQGVVFIQGYRTFCGPQNGYCSGAQAVVPTYNGYVQVYCQ